MGPPSGIQLYLKGGKDLEGGEQLRLLDPLLEDQVLRSNSFTSFSFNFAFCKYVGSEINGHTMFHSCILHPFPGACIENFAQSCPLKRLWLPLQRIAICFCCAI